MNRASSERAKKIVPNPCCTASLNRIEGVPRYSSTPIAAVLGPKSLRPKEYTQAGMARSRGAGSSQKDPLTGGSGAFQMTDPPNTFPIRKKDDIFAQGL